MAKRATKSVSRSLDDRSTAPDQAERDLITRELDKNMLVEAAAGTGKTTSLVARMVNLLREGRCRVDQIAAVTFTRKAAAELRSRFQLGLEKAAKAAQGDEKTRLAEAVAHVERCFVGTIHSFCGHLLRERPVEAGVDPEFRELDTEKDDELRTRAWTEHVAHLIAVNDPLIAELEDLGVDVPQLRLAFERFADYPDVVEWPSDEIELPDPAPIAAAIQNYAAHMEVLAPALPADPGNDKLIPQYRRFPRQVRHGNLALASDLYSLLERFAASTPNVVQKNWPGGKAQALAEKATWEQFAREHAIPYVEAIRAVRYHTILKVLRPAVVVYDRLRHSAGGLNFQDLLLIAARMLREYPTIRRYFRNRFTHLLVDEFQDTDPVQAEVMLLLTADNPNQTDWRHCRPVSGSLFVVGDPKQSIYRFRRADIVTYSEVKRIIRETGGLVVSLSANFRSSTSLVEWINDSFSRRFPSESTEIAPAHTPFQVGRVDERAGDLAGLYLLDAAGEKKEEILVGECALVARTIRHALDSGRTVPRSLRESEEPEQAQPGDFLIVTRNTTNLSRYANELQALGVPHQVTGGTSLNESEELRLLSTCLRALVRPDDPVALVAALRSELFGCSDASLYAFKRSGGQFSFREPVPHKGLSPDDSEAIRDAFDRLSRYYQWLFLMPPAASIEKIADHLGLFARAVASVGGDIKAGSLAKVVELVRAAESEQFSLMGIVEYLERLIRAEQKHDAISVRPHGAPVVRLMNLHKVKGLEAPIVFLSDPTGQFEHPIDLHVDRSGADARGYMAIFEPKSNVGYVPPRVLAYPSDWSRMEDKERGFQRAENERLLYVAATRAGTCLLVARRDKRPKENPWYSLAEDLSGREIHRDPGPQARPTRAELRITDDEIKAATAAIADRWAALEHKTYTTEPMKKLALGKLEPPSANVGFLPFALTDTAADEPPADIDPGEHGVEWGEDIHILLETAIREPGANLVYLARSLTHEREADDERVRALLDCVRAVQQSAIWRRARASKRVFAEIPLMITATANGTKTAPVTVRRGVIDLVFWENGGWVIVDYKTDRTELRPVSELVKHYSPQVESYADTWQSITGEPVHEVGLYFTRANRYERLRGK